MRSGFKLTSAWALVPVAALFIMELIDTWQTRSQSTTSITR